MSDSLVWGPQAMDAASRPGVQCGQSGAPRKAVGRKMVPRTRPQGEACPLFRQGFGPATLPGRQENFAVLARIQTVAGLGRGS